MSDIEKYRKLLPVNKHRLDDELEIQPDIMMRIASEVVVANGRMLEIKDELARLEARLSEELKEDDPKLTKDLLEGKVRRDSERRKLWERFQRARTDHESWSFLLEAWRERGFTLKTLANLYAAQYFASDGVVADERRRRRDDDLNERRAEMRRASHQPLAATVDEEDQPRRRRVAE